MKRSLELVVEPAHGVGAPSIRIYLGVGDRTVAVFDDGDGVEARRLADCMVATGAKRLEEAREANAPAFRILIRTRGDATRPYGDADLVLGSARRRFAEGFVPLLLGEL